MEAGMLIVESINVVGLIYIFLSFTFSKITCVEQQVLLDIRSNPLFTPVLVMEGATPLEDCVLSFSQFIGAERDSLVYLAGVLGARYSFCYCIFLFLKSQCAAIVYFFSSIQVLELKLFWIPFIYKTWCWSNETSLYSSSVFLSFKEIWSVLTQSDFYHNMLSLLFPSNWVSATFYSALEPINESQVFRCGLPSSLWLSRKGPLFLFSTIWLSLITVVSPIHPPSS